jgi:hypothetical protein
MRPSDPPVACRESTLGLRAYDGDNHCYLHALDLYTLMTSLVSAA